jgi:hypothetical protein
VGLTTPSSKKLTVTKVEQRKMLDGFNDDGRKRTTNTKIILATCNVQTAKTWKNERNNGREIGKARVDVVAVQEIRWQGKGRIDKKDFSVFYSGPKERAGRYGTGFVINAKMRKSFLSFFRAS